MSTRMDKTNSENVQTFAQIGMIKRKCPIDWTNWNDKAKMFTRVYILQCVGLTGFYNLSYKKI